MSCAPVQICIFPLRYIFNTNFFLMNDLGPATMRMTSKNRPDFPLSIQLPPGHVIQQVFDENGVLTNVIMSQTGPPPPPPPPHHHHHVVSSVIDRRFDLLLDLFSASRLFFLALQWSLRSSISQSNWLWTLSDR